MLNLYSSRWLIDCSESMAKVRSSNFPMLTVMTPYRYRMAEYSTRQVLDPGTGTDIPKFFLDDIPANGDECSLAHSSHGV